MDKLGELENRIKELSEEIERLKAEKENEPWKPKDGKQYWYINNSSGYMITAWHGDAVDKSRYAIGNVFRTQEEAEFRVEQLKVEAELRRFARPFDKDGNNWAFIYELKDKKITVGRYPGFLSCNICFASEEIAQKAIDTVGADRIKKYYFGVED